jgi:catechol 2,3-dioxygenase-like lactoylglutathione lyase family enzyme
MGIRRIVANLDTPDPGKASAFYAGILGMELAMDHGWIQTYAAETTEGRPQVSFATQGGSGTPVPDLSIEVDDLETVLQRVRSADITVEYGPVTEPWGVRRFYVRDPFGRLLNIVTHAESSHD